MGSQHNRYSIKYHLVWCPKRKAGNFHSEEGNLLKKILVDICARYRYMLHSLEVNKDFIHIALSVDPFVAPADIIRTLKSISAVHLLQQVPQMRTFYGRRGSLWKKGFLISTGETLEPEMLKRFLDDLLS